MASWQPVQVTYKAFVCLARVCGKRQVGKGAHSIYSGCNCSRRAYMSVLFIVVEVRVNTCSSLYRSVFTPPLIFGKSCMSPQRCHFLIFTCVVLEIYLRMKSVQFNNLKLVHNDICV